MTQNLRLAGGQTLTSEDSNVTSSWSFPNNSLDANGINYIGNSFTEAGWASDASYGGYYNFCAASAGTACNNTTKQDVVQDICPKGWRLPTFNEMNGIASYSSAFSPALSGSYYNGSLNLADSVGGWWSATAYNSNGQYSLYYNGSSSNVDGLSKDFGLSVRCVRSNSPSSGGDDSDNS